MTKIPKMSKQHFNFLADLANELNLSKPKKRQFALAISQTNPKFNWHKFLTRMGFKLK